jgi:hypothetical protein
MDPESTIRLMITSSNETVINLELSPYKHLAPSRVTYRVYSADNSMNRQGEILMEVSHDHTTGELRLCERILKYIQQNIALEQRRAMITPAHPTTKD